MSAELSQGTHRTSPLAAADIDAAARRISSVVTRTPLQYSDRLSALTEASEILVLQHGHIAQRGRHEALAVQPGWYRDMYRYQQLEAALDEVPQAQEEALDA